MNKIRKNVSILREKKIGEKRVILLPQNIPQFLEKGFNVYVETGAGEGIGISDDVYRNVGSKIVSTEEAWGNSDILIKYKPPAGDDFRFIDSSKHIGAVFHAEGDPDLTKKLMQSGCHAYTYEFFKTPEGIFPASVASSEIAGKVAVLYAAYHLQAHLGGSGVLLAPVPNVKPPKVLIIGYGNSGGAAARLAASMGADVVVLGTNKEKLRAFQASMPSNTRCYLNTPQILEREILDADITIGAILISTYDTPEMIDEKVVRRMKKGSIIVDVTAGYGPGYLSTFSNSTDFSLPIYEKYGILHCKIDVLPAAYPSTTVAAMSNHLTPYLVEMAEGIYQNQLSTTIAAGLIVSGGRVVHSEVLRHMEHWNRG